MYDLIIVGGGPAGVAAGVYASRKKIKTLLIAGEFGGQSLVSGDIQNWIGVKSISGFDLARNLEEHLRAQSIDILDGDLVEKVEKADGGFRILTKNSKSFEAKAFLVASGSRRRRLGVPGEDKLDGKGVSWCSTCDAPLFGGKIVAVIGAGNTGLEAARDLFSYASEVYLIIRSEKIRGDAVTFEAIKKDPRVKIIYMAETKEILGESFVTGLKYLDKTTNQIKELKLDGVFVEVGSLPNSDFVKNLVRLNDFGEIMIDHKTLRSSLDGIWAAGDVTDTPYKQNNISAGDAIKAVLNIHDYLNKK